MDTNYHKNWEHRQTVKSERRYSGNYHHTNARYSVGIACVKFIDGRPHMLMISKRYSYAFNDFVKGRYDKSDPKKNKRSKEILMSLFNKMTVEEKLTILSMDFSHIWYKLWVSNTKKGSYYKSKAIFDSMFLQDGGTRLRWLINKSLNKPLVWEIPKGKKICNSEPDIYCAVREFYEETGMKKKNYHIYPRIKKSISHSDQGILYHSTYYLAIAKSSMNPKIDFTNKSQLSEISDIRWMNIDNIRLIDENGNLSGFSRKMFKLAKKISKMC